MAATYAADLYRQGRISKIILTRPNVPAGRSLGYFPGSLSEKFGPWAAPIIDAIADRIGRAAHEIAVKNGDIELSVVGPRITLVLTTREFGMIRQAERYTHMPEGSPSVPEFSPRVIACASQDCSDSAGVPSDPPA